MSLGKLLTTGKSLVGLTNGASRYHMQKGALPKFVSAKNPFAARVPAELPVRQPQLPKLSPAEVAAANLKKTQPIPLLVPKFAPAVAEEKPAAPVVAVTEPAAPIAPVAQGIVAPIVAVPVEGWLQKVNPLVWFSGRKVAAKPAAVARSVTVPAPVQGELSLDNIKVMRNDLIEADVEVVASKPRAASAPTAPAAPMAIPELPPARQSWEYIGERLMGKP